MPNFYVSKLLEDSGIYRADTVVFGEVEIRPPKSDFKDELDAISKSIELSKVDIKQEFTCRIGTIIACSSIQEAELLADEKFVSVLDILSTEFAISHIGIAQCGYVKNLDDGHIEPIKSYSLTPSTVFVRNSRHFKKFDFNHWIVNQRTELSERYKKSIHWSRNAKWEKNLHLRILYHWFSVEALFKQDAQDDISSLLLLFLGFPLSTYSKHVSRELLATLEQKSEYTKWKRSIKDIADEIRVFRNDSVHSGFRNIDYSVAKLRLYHRIMSIGCARCQGAVVVALSNRVSTVNEFKEYAGIIFESRSNVIDDIFGNIIYILENDHMRDVERIYV